MPAGPADASPAAAKAALRATLRARRAARPAMERVRLGEVLAGGARRLPHLTGAHRVCGYLGVGTEPITAPLLDTLRATGVEVLLPLAGPAGALDWAWYDGPGALAPAALGLLEPTSPALGPAAAATADLLLVPALAVDRQGRRLGRGGGYYDRLLADLADGRRQPPAWAVVFDDEVIERVPAEPHDAPVQAILTAGGALAAVGPAGPG